MIENRPDMKNPSKLPGPKNQVDKVVNDSYLKPAEIGTLLRWHQTHGEPYPWSVGSDRTPDPYAVWVSEVMLQQTTVAAVQPRYRQWMHRFPTVESLASSSEDDVLREWEGLGYYTRARNLHSAAAEIRNLYGGAVPDDPERLRRLPGVGEYIAAAVASMAFGHPVAAVEANGRRIAQRFAAAVEWNPDLDKAFRSVVESAMESWGPGAVNAGVMQFGQRVCLPRRPNCDECPLSHRCLAKSWGMEEEIPKKRRRAVTRKTTELALLRIRGRVWIEKRKRGIGSGLWVFPALSEVRNIDEWVSGFELPVQIHLYTRYRDELKPKIHETSLREADLHEPTENGQWHTISDLSERAMPTAHRRIADDLIAATCTSQVDS